MSQNMDALALANELRLAGADIRREIRALPLAEGARLTAEFLPSPCAAVASMQVERLLLSIRRIGAHRAGKLLAEARITKVQQVREVTPGRRLRLARLLEELADTADEAVSRRTA